MQKSETSTMSDSPPNIILTERAANEIKDIMKENEFDAEKNFLRVGCKGGGCSGFTYILDISEDKREKDEVFPNHGVNVICDPKSLLYLNGTEIDFSAGIMDRGFVFKNPSAHTRCGCGSSFSV